MLFASTRRKDTQVFDLVKIHACEMNARRLCIANSSISYLPILSDVDLR